MTVLDLNCTWCVVVLDLNCTWYVTVFDMNCTWCVAVVYLNWTWDMTVLDLNWTWYVTVVYLNCTWCLNLHDLNLRDMWEYLIWTDFSYYKIHWRKDILSLKFQFIFIFIFNKFRLNLYLLRKSYSLFENVNKLCIYMHNSTKILDFPSSTTYKWIMQRLWRHHLRSNLHLE